MIKQKSGIPKNVERELKKAVINACTRTTSTDKERSGIMRAISAGRHLISRSNNAEEESVTAELYKTNTKRTRYSVVTELK